MDKSKFYKKYLPSMVYGGSDGAVSYFTLMAGAYGAGLSIKMLIAIGVSNIFADAFSMATADYLSEDSHTTNSTSSSLSSNPSSARVSVSTYLQPSPMRSGITTFISFLAIGFFPLAPSIYAYYTSSADSELPFDIFLISIGFTVFAFIFIGWMRGKVLGRDKWHTVLQSLLVCTISATFAYFIGEWVAMLLK